MDTSFYATCVQHSMINNDKSSVQVTKVRNEATIRNRYNQATYLTQDTTWESNKTQENITYKRIKRSDLSQQVTINAAMTRQESMTNTKHKKRKLELLETDKGSRIMPCCEKWDIQPFGDNLDYCSLDRTHIQS